MDKLQKLWDEFHDLQERLIKAHNIPLGLFGNDGRHLRAKLEKEIFQLEMDLRDAAKTLREAKEMI